MLPLNTDVVTRKPTLVLIDSNALIHRAYHALPPMSTRDGTPTNAVYGFALMLLKVFQVIKPTHLVAAFDVKGPTFRTRQYAAYKAHRKAADDELVQQFPLARELLEAFGIPVVEKRGYEADDILGTLAAQAGDAVRTVIVTGDMDAVQLVDATTSVFMLKRGVSDTVLYDEAVVREHFGFPPEFLIDYKGLRGDPSDNIPGVAGVGEKTARDLVGTYGSLEAIYEHLDELPGRARSKLAGHKRDALLSRQLATIVRDVSVTLDLDAAAVAQYDSGRVAEFFRRLEFRSLLQRLPARQAGLPQSESAVQPSLLAQRDVSDAPVSLPDHYRLVQTDADARSLCELLQKERVIAFDTETDYLGARSYPILGMSFAIRRGKHIEAWYVPVTPETAVSWKALLADERVGKVGHNLKYDLEVLRQSGIELKGIVFDSMIASYLLHPGARQHGLDTLAVQELDYHPIPLTDLIGSGKHQKKLSKVPVVDLARYACEDAEVALRLYEVFSPRIRDEALVRVLEELELPLIPVLADIELAGVRLDSGVLKQLGKRAERRLGVLQRKIWKAAGHEFNINSTQQLRGVLYDELRLPTVGIARTQTGFSTAASELEKLRGEHPVIVFLEEYRELSKLLNTYIEKLPGLVDERTGRIYASFNQTVTATGRLSSSDPNLQNIPVRTELGQEIRAAFVADASMQLVKADYSQIELRLVAHLSQDEKMLAAFRAGEDIHRATAAWVYGISPDDVSDVQRREAKTLNFGVLYGMGARNFARASGISVEKAQSFIERYREQYAGLAQFVEETIALAHELGYVTTLFGRKRLLPEIYSRTPAIRSQAERAAFNFPVQGTAADVLKKAMIAVSAGVHDSFPDARMVLTVHDELVVEVPSAAGAAFCRMMKEVMEGVITLDVPLVVDVSAGPNWQDQSAVTL